jgi:hypothetical protein
MIPVGRHRRRDGAMQWGIFYDMADAGRVVESFIVTSWAEHERQHHRTIVGDAEEEQAARDMLVAGDPVVTHFLALRPTGARPGSRRSRTRAVET